VIRSVLDRASLVQLAAAGGGEYFEIGAEPDRVVAFRIIDRLRRRADVQETETFEELYGRVLMAAAAVLCLGTVCLRRRAELVWHAAGALAAVWLLARLVRG
jgi:hypothetical protein